MEEKSNIGYVFKDTLLPNMKLKFEKEVLDKTVIANRIKIPITNLNIWFAPITSTIAFKEIILQSQKDEENSEHLWITFKENLDETEIDYFKKLIKKYK